MSGEEIVIAGMTKAERDALIKRSKAREAARLAAMTPEERAEHDRLRQLEEERDQWLGQPSTLTNGEIERDREMLEQVIDEAQGETEDAKIKTSNARTNQGAQDKKIAKLTAQVEKLTAQVAKLTEERDAARLELIQAKDRGK